MRFLQRCELALGFAALLYLTYRYPFQIGSASTSQGYSDTPLILQVGKYAVLGSIALLMAAAIASRANMTRLPTVGWVIFLASIYAATVSALGVPLTDNPEQLECAFVWGLAALLLLSSTPDVERMARLLYYFAIFAVAFTLMQVALFFGAGRMPGVSIDDSILVRFGGPWDDPNGYAMALSLLLPLAFHMTRTGARRILFVGLGLACLLATQSLTGIFSFIVAMGAGTLLLLVIRSFAVSRNAIAWCITALVVAAPIVGGAMLLLPIEEALTAYLELKSGSIEIHAQGFGILQDAPPYAYLGFAPMKEWGEMGYVNWLTNYGALYAAANIFTLLTMLLASAICTRLARNETEKSFFIAGTYFLIAFSVGLGNLPLDVVFPVNFLALWIGTAALRVCWARMTVASRHDASSGVGAALIHEAPRSRTTPAEMNNAMKNAASAHTSGFGDEGSSGGTARSMTFST